MNATATTVRDAGEGDIGAHSAETARACEIDCHRTPAPSARASRSLSGSAQLAGARARSELRLLAVLLALQQASTVGGRWR
jgi:hypothetical protein